LGDPANDLCQEVTASIGLFLDDESVLVVQQLFQSALNRAIMNGRLQEILRDNYPDSIVAVITGEESDGGVIATEPPISRGNVEGLSEGGTAGVAIAAAAFVGLLAGALFVVSRRPSEDKKEPAELVPVPATGLEWGDPSTGKGDEESGSGVVGASKLKYGKTKPKYGKTAAGEPRKPTEQAAGEAMGSIKLISGIYVKAQEEEAKQADGGQQAIEVLSQMSSDSHSFTDANSTDDKESEISYENSSGWSDQYTSSKGTMESSMGTMESDEFMPAQRLVDLGADPDIMEQPPNPGVTNFDDLEAAIICGDWAAVGASAALLAATKYDSGSARSSNQSNESARSGLSSMRSNRSPTWKMSLDAKKAAELEKLIDQGDWEGVIQAAAKYEAQTNKEAQNSEQDEDNSESKSESQAAASAPSSEYHPSTASGEGSGTHPSVSTLSATTTPTRDVEEIRKDVVDLVERVVPEELDNVDEMMTQFRGREEELLETLRTMAERDVALKAQKAESRKVSLEASGIAERDERRLAATEAASARQDSLLEPSSSSEGVMASTGSAVANPDSAASSSQASVVGQAIASKLSDEESTERQRHRDALLMAISANNWEAVGEAAAILSDTDETTFRRTFESSMSVSTSETGRKYRNRQEELTQLIERGDWLQVVAAASRFSEADKQKTDASDTSDDAARLERQLKEEKEALRQAEMWMDIARQSKVQSGAEGAAAADAADWAIARSLSLLEKNDAKGEGPHKDAESQDQESV
jgi:hypothetical protein